MANLTVFQGRRCTKVLRRAVNNTSAATPIPKAAGSTAGTVAATPATTSLAKGTAALTTSLSTSVTTSVFAPTTNTPAISGQQIATVIIPNIASLVDPLTGPQVTPIPAPAPQVTNTPVPVPVPIASARPNPPQASSPASVALPPTVQPTGVPQTPNNIPPPALAPPNPSPNPPAPPQQQPSNSQPQNPQPVNTQPQQSSRPQQGQQPPTQPQNSPPANQDPQQGGRGGGSGGSAPDLSQPQPQATGGQPAQVGLPMLPSSILGQPLPPLPQAQSQESKTSGTTLPPVVPIAVTLTSNGLTRTTFSTPTLSSVGKATDLGRLQPSRSQPTTKSTGGAGIVAGSGAGVTEKPARHNSTAIIAGVVSAFVVLGIICAVIFLRARKKKQTPRDVVISSHYSTRSNSVRNVRSFFSHRFSRSADSGVVGSRTNTPALESGMERTPYMTEIDPSRRRSSSEPANRSFLASPGRQSKVSGDSGTGAPILPSPSPHRRSVSSLSGMAYPVLTHTNNPFMDPDPNAPLRIVNPDLSRSGSTATNPRTPGQTPKKIGAADAGAGATGPMTALKMSPSPLKQATSFLPVNRSIHQRMPSIVQDPFMDPETIMEDPFADPIEPPPIAAARNSRMGSHQRNKSSIATSASQYSDASPELSGEAHQRLMAGVPLITKTAPSSVGSSHRHNGSGDSGFVSSHSSPALHQSTRFNGLGISNLLQRSTAIQTSLLPTAASRDQSLLQPVAATGPRPPVTPADRRISHNRLSSTSSASDLSLSFPSSWGSPGPTRPASIATQGGGSNPSLAAALAVANANYPSVMRPRDSRASDPFDLDDPTLLSYAASEVGGYQIATLTRENSERSIGNAHKRSDTAPK